MGNTSSSPVSYQPENSGLSQNLTDTNKRSHSRRQSQFIGYSNKTKQLRLNSFKKDANGSSTDRNKEPYSECDSNNYITTSSLPTETRHSSLIPPEISPATATGQTTRNNSVETTETLQSNFHDKKAYPINNNIKNNATVEKSFGERRLSQPIPIPRSSGNSRNKNDDSYSKNLVDKNIGSARDDKIKGCIVNGNGHSDAVHELFKNSKVFPVEKKIENNDDGGISTNEYQPISPTSKSAVLEKVDKNTTQPSNIYQEGNILNDNSFKFSAARIYEEEEDEYDQDDEEDEDTTMDIPENNENDHNSAQADENMLLNNTIHGDIINKYDEEIEANVLLDYINNDHTFDGFKVPVTIRWMGKANEVFVVGSFSNWIQRLRLNKISEDEFAIQLFLKIGFYRFQFIVDGETRWSNNFPKATEANGNFVNWFEVVQQDTRVPSKDESQPNNYFFEDTNTASINSIVTPEASSINRRVSVSKPQQHYSGKVLDNNNDDYFGIINDEDENNLNEMKQRSANSYTVSNSEIAGNENTIGKVPFYNSNSSFSQPILTPVPRVFQEYSSQIPDIYINTDDFNEFQMDSTTMLKIKKLPQPPSLPPYLNNVLLNKKERNYVSPEKSSTSQKFTLQSESHNNPQGSNGKISNSGSSWNYENLGISTSPRHTPGTNPTNDKNILNIPNHVILNHLITTSIKNNVLAVACINRYGGKFVTQVMYCPIENNKNP